MKIDHIKKEFLKNFNKFLPQFLPSFTILATFYITVDIYKYLTTEYWWTQDSIKYNQTGIFLLVLIFLSTFLDWEKLYKKRKKITYLIIFLFVFSLLAHEKYSIFYEKLQNYPKIKSVNKNWGIQGSWAKIVGRNFGPPHEPGKVMLGEEEMIVKQWNDKEIIFEVPLGIEAGDYRISVKNNKEKILISDFKYELKKL